MCLISFVYVLLCLKLQKPVSTNTTPTVGHCLDLWKQGTDYATYHWTYGNHAVWMISGWFHHFPMKALIVPQSHVFVEFRQLQWGKGRPSVAVLMNLCMWTLENGIYTSGSAYYGEGRCIASQHSENTSHIVGQNVTANSQNSYSNAL